MGVELGLSLGLKKEGPSFLLEEGRSLLERGKELPNWEGMLVRDWPES